MPLFKESQADKLKESQYLSITAMRDHRIIQIRMQCKE